MKSFGLIIFIGFVLAVVSFEVTAEEVLSINVDGKALVGYQAEPMSNPLGGDKFKGSDFIHPLKTPSGFVVTCLQPDDHYHHFGLWWPWKYIEVDGRKILCWELQGGEGLIQAQESGVTDNGFTAKSIYIDRKAPGGPQTLINETVKATVSKIMNEPASGYYLDIEITHETAVDKPVTIVKYHYSGFSFRGTELWNKDTCSILTDQGKNYNADSSRAKWVRVEGRTGDGDRTAGVVIMSRPDNRDHPQMLRVWDEKIHNGEIFVNFNAVRTNEWVFESGKKYTGNYRIFVYDGKVSAEQAESLWGQYSNGK